MPVSDSLSHLIGAEEGLVGAILGTGMSIEDGRFSGALLEEVGAKVTIGMNSACKFYQCDYHIVTDVNAMKKAWMHLCAPTKLVISRNVGKLIRETTPFDPVSNRRADEILETMDVTELLCRPEPRGEETLKWLYHGTGVLTGALSLACALGLRKVYIFGCDFYRRTETAYAYGVEQAPPRVLYPHGEYWTTDDMRGMVASVENSLSVWEGLEVVNLSRYSLLRCFPVDEELALPRL